MPTQGVDQARPPQGAALAPVTCVPGPATSVEVVLFDFDGVIRHWRTELVDELERRAGLPPGVILLTAQQVPEYELGVRGHVSFDDWCRATAIALEPVAGRHAVDVVAEWSRYRGDLDDCMVNFVAGLASTTRVGLLSNAHDRLRRDLRELGIDALFEHVICSAEVGVAKPDPEIYAIAADTFGVTPAACAFTDDLAANVRAAQDAGMRSHEFREPASCARFIRAQLAPSLDDRRPLDVGDVAGPRGGVA